MFKLKTLLGAFICGVLALGTGIGLNVAGNETLGSAKAAASGPVVAEMSTFVETNTSNIGGDSNVYYTTAKGGGTSDPAINDGEIRLYQNSAGSLGGNITIHAIDGVTITDVYTTSSMQTTLAYALDGGSEFLNETSVAANEEYAINGLNAKSVTIGCFGTSKSTRYYVNYIGVNYIAEDKGELLELTYEGTPVTQYAGQEFNADGLTFTATYTTGPIVVPASAITFTPSVLTKDTTSITATYEEKTVEIPVVVAVETKLMFGSHSDFATWNSSYTTRTLDYPDVTFTWESANKQSSTITDMPVSKGKSLTITSKVKSIKSVELGFKQWTTKTQTINAIIDDVVVSTMEFPAEGTVLVVNITETNVKELVINATNTSNQIGWEYAIVEYYDVDPNVLAVQEFIENYLHPEIATDNNADTGACLGVDGYYEKAKVAFNNLTPEQRRMFIEDVLFAAMYARLSAWARANHETFDASTNMLVSANVNTNNIISNEGYLTVIIAVSMLAVSLIAIFAFTKKKAIHR